jgi:hypothetical protein
MAPPSQGFIAATSWKRAGYATWALVGATITQAD